MARCWRTGSSAGFESASGTMVEGIIVNRQFTHHSLSPTTPARQKQNDANGSDLDDGRLDRVYVGGEGWRCTGSRCR